MAPGTRLYPFSFAISDDVLPRDYHIVVRVEFVSRADQMIEISWHFSVFAELVHLASASLPAKNTNFHLPPPDRLITFGFVCTFFHKHTGMQFTI